MKWTNPLARQTAWPSEISNRQDKEKIAETIAVKAKENEVIGVGSGTTSYLALSALAKRNKKENLNLSVIPTSKEIELYAIAFGFNTLALTQAAPDWYFDGADEYHKQTHALIKGRGGAMYLEKLVMQSSRQSFILIDTSKFVTQLGEKFAIPVEVDKIALHFVETKLRDFGATAVSLRIAGKGKDGPVISESGHYILDVEFKKIEAGLEKKIKCLTGVIECGLFQNKDFEVITTD